MTTNSNASHANLQRERLRRWIEQQPIEKVSPEEIEAHFEGMPSHYWERVTESELTWGLESVHQFLYGLVASPSGTTPAVVTWRHFPERGVTKVLVSTWDRAGLLTKFAGYTAALRLNIVRAEIYTRADNIVLDVFWVSDNGRHISDEERLRQIAFLIEGGLSEPPRFVSTWACESHKYVPRKQGATTNVTFDNDSAPAHTMVAVETAERLGLLHDMLQSMTAHGLNISEAFIDTEGEVARDVFYVTDTHRRKVDASQFASIEATLAQALD